MKLLAASERQTECDKGKQKPTWLRYGRHVCRRSNSCFPIGLLNSDATIPRVSAQRRSIRFVCFRQTRVGRNSGITHAHSMARRYQLDCQNAKRHRI